MAIEVILLPKIINDKSVYATLDYYRYLTNMMPLLLMGIHSGYLKCIYNHNKDLRNELINGGFILLFILGIIVSICFNKFVLIILILSNGLAIFYEKIYQKDSKYLQAISFKPILSLLVISTIVMFSKNITNSNIINFLAIPYILAFIFFARKDICSLKLKNDNTKIIKGIKSLIKSGFWLNFGTLTISLYYFTDRTILRGINTIELANYAFAFNIAQGFFIFFTGLAFINENNFGEIFNCFDKQRYLLELKKTLKYFLAVFIVAVLSFLFITTFFLTNYSDSFFYLIMIMLSWGFYFASSPIFPLLQYLNLQKKASLILLSILIFNILIYKVLVANFIVYSGVYLVLQSSLLVFTYTIILLRMIYVKIICHKNIEK